MGWGLLGVHPRQGDAPYTSNSSFNSPLVPTSIRLSITARHTVEISKVHVVIVVASWLVVGLDMLSVAAKLS